MLHLATSSPCSHSKIYAFDNKSKENQKFLNNLPHLQKIGTKNRPGMWPFRLLKASFKHLFQRLAERNSRVCGFVCVCVGVGKPPPKTQPPPNVNWWAGRGRANETENAVLILISAHVEKKRQNCQGSKCQRWATKDSCCRRKVDSWEGWGVVFYVGPEGGKHDLF